MSTRKNHSNGEKFKVIFFFFQISKVRTFSTTEVDSFIWVIGARSLDTRKGYLYPKIFCFCFFGNKVIK